MPDPVIGERETAPQPTHAGREAASADSRASRTPSTDNVPAARVAYLNTEYPSLSHTFIEREVRAVRACGMDVRTYSIRRPGASGRLGEEHRAAAEGTAYLVDGALRTALSFAVAALSRPFGALRAHAAAQTLASGGLRDRLRHAAYAAEGVRLAVLLRRDGISHVHVHMANNGAMVALLAARCDPELRYSLSIHGSAEFFDVHRLRLGAKAEGAAFVRCISNFCRAQVMAWTAPSAWARMHVVPTGVDLREFAPPPDRPQDRLRLVTVGRFVPIKAYEVLLDACARLDEHGKDWMLTMVGDGPLRGAIERRAAERGLADRVTFAGAAAPEEVLRHLHRSNVLVVSSFMEGVPVVLMEALATGMAVVATRVGGVGDVVEDGRNGLLVDPGSAEALAGALERLRTDAGLRRSLGESARAAVVSGFDIDRTGREMARLLASCGPGDDAARAGGDAR